MNIYWVTIICQTLLCSLDCKAFSHVILFKSEQVYIIKYQTVQSIKICIKLEERDTSYATFRDSSTEVRGFELGQDVELFGASEVGLATHSRGKGSNPKEARSRS